MASRNLLAFDPSALTLAIADDHDLLVHGGPEEVPLWVRKLPAPITGVGAGGGLITTLDERGVVSWWSTSGEVYSTVTVGDGGLSLATAPDGQACAVLFADRVVLTERGAASRTIRIAGATATAFSTDGGRVAIGTETGQVRILTFAGEPMGESQLEAAVRSVASSVRGAWYLTSADRVLRIGPTGGEAHRVTRAGGYEPDCISVSADGALFAVRLDDSTVVALGDPPGETVASVTYPERKVSGVAFGGGRILGVALAGGDGNYVDIPNKQLRRTETFEGRTHNRWLVQVGMKPEAAPPAQQSAPPQARPSAPAPKPAAPAHSPAPVTNAGEQSTPRQSGARSWALGILSLLLLVVAVYWKVSAEEREAKEERDRQMKEDIQKSVRDSVKKSMKK